MTLRQGLNIRIRLLRTHVVRIFEGPGRLDGGVDPPGFALRVLDRQGVLDATPLIKVVTSILRQKYVGKTAAPCISLLHNNVVVAIIDRGQRACVKVLPDERSVLYKDMKEVGVSILCLVLLVSYCILCELRQLRTKHVLIDMILFILVFQLLPCVEQ